VTEVSRAPRATRAVEEGFRADPSRPAGRLFAAVLLALSPCLGAGTAAGDPCADDVVHFEVGFDGGFQSDLLPGVVLGPPVGGGQTTGSLDVVALGDDGSITVAFRDNEIVDGPGPDFVVFENAFFPRGAPLPFVEAGIVGVSTDGASFAEFPFDASSFAGLAGVSPVFSSPANAIDPRSPAAGGDAFDLAALGLASARFVRIRDPGEAVPDPGNAFPVIGVRQSGFDLDAVVATSSRELCAGCCDATGEGLVSIADVALLLGQLSGAAPATGVCGPAPCAARTCGDPSGDGAVGELDVGLCLEMAVELSIECAGGLCDRS
jgi:hypothetical protein